jgi:hypothetical protein
MARHLNTKHTIKNLRDAMRGGKGLETFHRLMRDEKIKKAILEDMGVPMADVDRMKAHIAEETNQLGRQLKSKKDIIRHYRGKWAMTDQKAKQLLESIAPEDKGLTPEQIEKMKERNRRLQRMYSRFHGTLKKRFASDQGANKGEDTRNRILNKHKPEDLRGDSATEHTVGVVAAGGSPGVVGGAPSGATGLTNTRPLEVKDGTMKVATHEGSGMAIKPGEKPKEPEEEKPAKKSPPPDLALAA